MFVPSSVHRENHKRSLIHRFSHVIGECCGPGLTYVRTWGSSMYTPQSISVLRTGGGTRFVILWCVFYFFSLSSLSLVGRCAHLRQHERTVLNPNPSITPHPLPHHPLSPPTPQPTIGRVSIYFLMGIGGRTSYAVFPPPLVSPVYPIGAVSLG
jgi:hypothetical protein